MKTDREMLVSFCVIAMLMILAAYNACGGAP